MSEEDKTKAAQKIYDAVLNAFPDIRKLMISAQACATRKGYVETILGRRRHIPEMQLPKYEFHAGKGYVNPDIDPLDVNTLHNKSEIPERIVEELQHEFSNYKYNGQVYKRIRELKEEHINVTNNTSKIQEASRKCVNCVDLETEILTTSGWKHYDEVKIGDTILSYSLDKQRITEDKVLSIHVSIEPTDGVIFETPTFYSISTMNHRWVVGDIDVDSHIATTEHICTRIEEEPIIRIADNDLDFKLLYPGETLEYDSILELLTFDRISKLSQPIAKSTLEIILKEYGQGIDDKGHKLRNSTMYYMTSSGEQKDAFQYLCVVAGYATLATKVMDDTIWKITVLSSNRVSLSSRNMRPCKCNGVWCVTTNNGTWIARRNGGVYITGNSIIQGSAAEMTKMAMLKLENNPEWKAIGGRLLVPVHDELICEVPMDNWEKGAEILSNMMVEAGSFLPFAVSCDVTTTLRWYGLEYPCIYTKPQDIDNLDSLSDDEIKWIQYHILEMEYLLPIYKNEDGSKPIGDAALGINGVVSDELKDAIDDYIRKRRIAQDEFIDAIETEVTYGYESFNDIYNNMKERN